MNDLITKWLTNMLRSTSNIKLVENFAILGTLSIIIQILGCLQKT